MFPPRPLRAAFPGMCPPRPILFVVGDRAHSKFFSENAYTAAREAGNQVEKIELYDSFCKGCLACQKTLRCVIHDDEMGKCV